VLKPLFIPKVFDLVFLAEPQMRRCCGPIFFTRPAKEMTGENIIDNGSFGLVDTGEMKLLVTCQHVWDGFRKLHDAQPELEMAIVLGGEVRVLGALQPVDADEHLDIATFDMAPFLKDLPQDCSFFQYDCKRPQLVKSGDALAFIGYPGRVRADTSLGVRFKRQANAVFAYDLNETTIVTDVSRLMPGLRDGLGDQVPDMDFGGISGSPCFLVRPNATLRLVGFAKEGALKMLKLTRVSCLNADGTITRFP
jgi:hypothetical protein